MRGRVPSVCIAVALFCVTLGAQEHPNVTRGFIPGQTFPAGDIDAVNVFNGAVTVTLPIGQAYHVNGGLSYGFVLSYTGQPWDLDTDAEDQADYYPARISNAGLGWMLSLGRLLAPLDPDNNSPGGWVYVTPDGHGHVFGSYLHTPGDAGQSGAMFTTDGTYIRLRAAAPYYEVDLPDNTKQFFLQYDANRWRLSGFSDSFGNNVNVTYGVDPGRSCGGGAIVCSTIWTINDGVRAHRVYFQSTTANRLGTPRAYEQLDHITLAGPPTVNGASQDVNYTFTYTPTWLTDPPGSQYNVDTPELVSLLTGITGPAGDSYTITYGASLYDSPSGYIASITRPTGAKIAWTYSTYRFPGDGTARSYELVPGVYARSITDPLTSATATWTYYEGAPSATVTCFSRPYRRDVVRRVTAPDGTYTHHFFSLYPNDYDSCSDSSWGYYPGEYGLPMTRRPGYNTTMTQDGSTVFRSVDTFKPDGTTVKELFVRFEYDALLSSYETTSNNRRQSASVELYSGDLVGSEPARVERRYARFDGVGHYREAKTSGNFGSGDVRTVATEYTGIANIGSDPWLPNRYTSQWATQVNGGASSASKVGACFDSATGALKGRRVYVGGAGTPDGIGAAGGDRVTVYKYSARGNLLTEYYLGGDNTPVSSDPICTIADSTPTTGAGNYRIDNTYDESAGVLGAQRTSAYSGATFKNIDRTPDANTDLTRSYTEPSGLTATFGYDALGRITNFQPSEGAETQYVYTPASPTGTPTSPARVTVKHTYSDPDSTPAPQESYDYDGVGRLWKERRLMSDGSTAVRERAYDAMGRVRSVSEWMNSESPSSKTTTAYDVLGRPSVITPPDGSAHATTLTWTGSGVREFTRTVSVATTKQQTAPVTVAETPQATVETYDPHGRLWKVTEPSGYNTSVTTTYSYDVNNQLMSVQTAAEGITQTRLFAYDGGGVLIAETHPELGIAGNVTARYTHDARGHVLSRILDNDTGGAARLNYVWDSNERLTDVNNISTANPLKHFDYWSSGRGNGRVQRAIRFNRVGPANTWSVGETYSYDGLAARVSSRVTCIAPQVISTDDPCTLANNRQFTLSQSAFDPLGNVKGLTYPACSGCGVGPLFTLSRQFKAGLLRSINGYATLIDYWPNLAMKKVTHITGAVDNESLDTYMPRPLALSTTYAGGTWGTGSYLYDGAGNVKNIGSDYYVYDGVSRVVEGSAFQAGAGTVAHYEYDAFGNRTQPTLQSMNPREGTFVGGSQVTITGHGFRSGVTVTFGGAVAATTSVTDTQITCTTPPFCPNGACYGQGAVTVAVTNPSGTSGLWSNGYWYWNPANPRGDANGNWTIDQGDVNYLINYLFAGGPAPIHDGDANGSGSVEVGDIFYLINYVNNTTGTSLPWADATTNRLTIASYQSPGGNMTTNEFSDTFAWDALDSMVTSSGNRNWTFLYSADDERIGTYDRDSLVWHWTLRGLGNEVLREFTSTGGTGDLDSWTWERDYVYRDSALLASNSRTAGITHYHLDHLGTPRILTNGSGSLVSAFAYYPFGLEATNVATDAELLKFTGQERDRRYPSTYLDYMHARYYSPSLRRFLSVDPITLNYANPQSWNRYAYVRNNPLRYTDPLGLFECDNRGNCWDNITITANDPGFNSFLAVGASYMNGFANLGNTTLGRELTNATYLTPGDFSNGETTLHAFEAFTDGLVPDIPFCGSDVCDKISDPFAANGYYDVTEPGMEAAQVIGATTRDIEAALVASGSPSLFGQNRWLNTGKNLRIGHSTQLVKGSANRVWFSARGKWIQNLTGKGHVNLWIVRYLPPGIAK